MTLRYTFRPLGPWTEGDTANRRSRWTFKATWDAALRLLEDELWYLDAEGLVLQADFRAQDLRVDGTIRANARQPVHPGVRIVFASKHGPLTYATDSCAYWEHNVRSIALGLQALRAVDRYGVTKRGEQYTGWAQLGTGPASSTEMSTIQALDRIAFWTGTLYDQLPRDRDELSRSLRKARAAAHPDRNAGDSTAFLQLEHAGRTLGRLTPPRTGPGGCCNTPLTEPTWHSTRRTGRPSRNPAARSSPWSWRWTVECA